MLRSAGVGILVGLAWAATYSLFAFPSGAAGAVAVIPVVEEAIRFAALSALYAWQPTRTTPIRTRGLGFGWGFGGTEALLRWGDALAPGSQSTVLGFVIPVAPLLLHVLLSIGMSKALSLHRPGLGFFCCVVLHASYNSYVWFVLLRASSLQLALLQFGALMLVVLATLLWSLRAWREENS